MNGRKIYWPRGRGLGRLVVDQRPHLYPWPASGLRRLEQRPATAGGAGATCCRISSAARAIERGASDVHGGDGPLACSDIGAKHELIEAIIARRGRAGCPAHRRLQRRRAGGRRLLPALYEEGTALQHRRRLPATGEVAREPRRRGRRAGHAHPVRRHARDGSRVSARRRSEARERGARSDRRRGFAAKPATAAAVRHRARPAPAAIWHSRRSRSSGRGRKSAGSSAIAAHLQMHEADHDQRRPQVAVAIGEDRPAVAAAAHGAAGSRHQPGRTVHARAAGIDDARHPVSLRDAVRRLSRRQAASFFRIHDERLPVAADLARPRAGSSRPTRSPRRRCSPITFRPSTIGDARSPPSSSRAGWRRPTR